MKILIYGAGNIGSLYAALLKNSGQNVTLLARGKRAADVRERGLRLQSVETGERLEVKLPVVEQLAPDDHYELIMVAMPRHCVSQILPDLAANRSPVLFFTNCAAGPEALIKALGKERVLLGFPGAAAVMKNGWLHYFITSHLEQPTTIGELDGTVSSRLERIAATFKEAGFPPAICSRMDAWLKTHYAKIGPTIYALYMAGGDASRLSRTPDALLLMLRAIREGFRVLEALDIPITPANHRIIEWLPEPLCVQIFGRMLLGKEAAIKIGHAEQARTEMQLLSEEFQQLVDSSSVPTPALDRLRAYQDPSEEPMSEGSKELGARWTSVWVAGGCLVLAAYLFLKR